MKMKRIRQNGFVLVLVIIAMAVIGLEMFVLAGGANTMLFQANNTYLRAVERDLAASGLAWAKRNIKNEGKAPFDTPIDLDVTKMDIHGATLSVTIGFPEDGKAEVQINTLCSRGRQTLRRRSIYHIESKP